MCIFSSKNQFFSKTMRVGSKSFRGWNKTRKPVRIRWETFAESFRNFEKIVFWQKKSIKKKKLNKKKIYISQKKKDIDNNHYILYFQDNSNQSIFTFIHRGNSTQKNPKWLQLSKLQKLDSPTEEHMKSWTTNNTFQDITHWNGQT